MKLISSNIIDIIIIHIKKNITKGVKHQSIDRKKMAKVNLIWVDGDQLIQYY